MTFLSNKKIRYALLIYFAYLAIFYFTWAVTKVDYPSIGKNEQSLMLWYALPTLLASSFVIIAISALGWWKATFFETKKFGSKWIYALPALILMVIVFNFSNTNVGSLTIGIIAWSILGGIGVGFGEEIITRGSLLVGLRSQYREGLVWLYSTLFFAALHIPNVLFGLDIALMLIQLVLTFIMGSALYVIRRLSGSLLPAIALHGLWDTSIFLPMATGSQGFAAGALAVYILAVICTIPIVKTSWSKRLASQN